MSERELQIPGLETALAQRQTELLPQVTTCYAELRALARPERRAMQRRLGRSRDLTRLLEGWLTRGMGRTVQRRLARSLVGAALLLALGQGVAQADTITVTTKNPAINADGLCSLIEAIENANADATTHTDCPAGTGADVIVLPSKATITLSTVDNTDLDPSLPLGLPVIASPITIEGNGAKITRKKAAPPFGLFGVDTSGDLTLKNLTLSGGFGVGGAVINDGTVSIQNSKISGNTGDGGAGGIYNAGTMTIQNSTVSGNKISGDYGAGAGILNIGTMTIQNSTISGNKLSGEYGAGGGILNDGDLTIENSTISGNSVAAVLGAGGGIAHYSGTLVIRNSTITGNKTSGVLGVGAGVANEGTLTIENSTISKNNAGSTYGYGGGIANVGDLTITNSTISTNTARSYGGGVSNDGTAIVENATITGNKVSDTKYGTGGGIDNIGDLTLSRSLVSGNKAHAGAEVYNYSGSVTPGSVTADDFNLFGAKNNSGLEGFSKGSPTSCRVRPSR